MINPLPDSPWVRSTTLNTSHDINNSDFTDLYTPHMSNIQKFLSSLLKNDILLYTDGSKNFEGDVGIDHFIY